MRSFPKSRPARTEWQIGIFNALGTTQVLVDITGWFSEPAWSRQVR
jgi:hypothetical protein